MRLPRPGIKPPSMTLWGLSATGVVRWNNSMTRVVITPVRYTHTRLHSLLSNICSSPSNIQHTSGLSSPACIFTATLSPVFGTEARPIGNAWQGEPRTTVIGRHCNSVETAQPRDQTTDPDIMRSECNQCGNHPSPSYKQPATHAKEKDKLWTNQGFLLDEKIVEYHISCKITSIIINVAIETMI